jgi:hypothetical protein
VSYTKIVQSGTLIEVYSYEGEPNPKAPVRKKSRFKNSRRYTRSFQRARSSFFRLVRSNVSPENRPALVTLTMREVVSIREGWRGFTLFAQRLKNSTKGKVSYIAVPEFQERGAVHFHALVWGLTDEEIIGERSTRRIARLWGHGYIDIRSTDGSPKLIGYLSKYMSKAMFDPRLSGQKAYSASRNIVRSVSLNTPTQIDIATRIWGLGVDIHPLTERIYQTEWLGKCVYKSYDIGICE